MHGRTHGRTENIDSIFRDKLLLLGEHGLPLRQTVESFQSIFMWIAPAGTTDLDFASFRNGQPTSDQLIDLEWVQVKIGCAPEQIVVLRGGTHAKRM